MYIHTFMPDNCTVSDLVEMRLTSETKMAVLLLKFKAALINNESRVCNVKTWA